MARSTHQETPIFCFRHADRATSQPWVFKPDPTHAPELISFICDKARNTWAEIEQERTGSRARHKKHHSQPIDSLDLDAQQDITKAELSETFGDEIFRFRLASEKRLWGFRQGRVFHVVWWDPDHKVYPTEPT
jgi:hypothetical protein